MGEKLVNTIDTVLLEMQSWRNQKKKDNSNRGIPDPIWLKLFNLEEKYSDTDIRRIFKLNSKQYHIKHKELISSKQTTKPTKDNLSQQSSKSIPDPTKSKSIPDPTKSKFCEVKVKPETPIPPLTENLKTSERSVMTLRTQDHNLQDALNLKTVVAEYIRPDGYKLKIHTTNESLTDIVNAFCQLSGSVQ